ncbi:MAG: sulfatase-like hydrolase/transferase [Opitutales bacterium]|nr:sulfatase-like hydrolase/transferase [Opitutales bacterium]
MRRSPLFVSLLMFSCLIFAKSSQPNIILIYMDDMGVGDASFTSGDVIPTPNIDKMAAEGKVFKSYYTSSPVCSPSRVGVTTGMYPLRWDINTFLSSRKHNKLCDQSDFLDPKAPSLARTLKTVGYQTAHIGKWHMGGGRDVTAPSIAEYGFDEFWSTWESPNADPLLTSTNWIWGPEDVVKRWDRTSYFVDRTLEFLKKNRDKPCYINLWPDDVHSPWLSSPAELEADKRGYFTLENLVSVIVEMDVQIGRLIQGLKVLGIDENTLILFTSDNGPAPTFDRSRTNGMRGAKNSLYEGGINMPFVAYWPGTIEAGQSDEASVISAVDLFPTLCSLAGASLPESFEFDGEDVTEALIGEVVYKRERKVFFEYGRKNPKYSIPKIEDEVSPVLAVIDGDWKCLTSFDGSELELYNLASDPNETQNLADEYQTLAEQLKQEMLNWFAKNNESEVL